MTVRFAVHADKPRCLRMLKESHAAAQLPFPFSAPYAARLFDHQTSLPDRCCIVFEHNGSARGVLMASIAEHPFGPFRVASEVVWWIDPQCRGLAGGLMLNLYEDWAKENGCIFVGMAVMTSAPGAKVLYRRRGYQEAETHYLKLL